MDVLLIILSAALLDFAFVCLFILPFLLPVLWVVFLYCYRSAKKKNKITPGTVPEAKIKRLKTALIVLAIVTGVFLLIVIGLIVLMNLAVAYM